jgi:hypothetical protein
MLEAIAFALAKSLAVYLFERQLENLGTTDIEGAPAWYATSKRNHVCGSGYAQGGLGAVDTAKRRSRARLVERIDGAIEVMIHEEFGDVSDPLEQKVLERMKTDEDLPVFIRGEARLLNVKYAEDRRLAFARACVPREPLIAYQEERIEAIRIGVLKAHKGAAFEELDDSFGNPSSGSSPAPGESADPFDDPFFD